MSKRVNNHKGWPSKNKANNRYLRTMRSKQDKLRKLHGKKSLGKEMLGKVAKAFKIVSRKIKQATPKRFNRTR